MHKAYITVGLGFGDEGKGATTEFLVQEAFVNHKIPVVVRYCGGSQCGHNVQNDSGRRHTFSQFGAGTIRGAKTFLDKNVIINPRAMVREAAHLCTMGVPEPFRALTVHPECLVSTVHHQQLNKAREVLRGCENHGTCGHGIGEVRLFHLRHPEESIKANDLLSYDVLTEKLQFLKEYCRKELHPLDEALTSLLRSHRAELPTARDVDILEDLYSDSYSLHICEDLPSHDTLVFEGAQGVLLDETYGFHPYTTWSTTTTKHALERVRAMGITDVKVIGVTRAYATRHGAGPFPTYDQKLTESFPDLGNPHNVWQGGMRLGWLDLPLLRYAIAATGGIDELAVNCLDEYELSDQKVCTEYPFEFSCPDIPTTKSQEDLCQKLMYGLPLTIKNCSSGELLNRLGELAPVAIRGHGPTAKDRRKIV